MTSIMIEIENIKRFPKIKQIVAFYGLHPVFKESGDTSQTFRNSRKISSPFNILNSYF